jgi:phage protein D
VNGSAIPPEAETDLFVLETTDAVDEIGMVMLSLNAGDPRSGRVKWVDGDPFQLGAEVRVKVGFHVPLIEVMVAEITALEPEFPEAGPIQLTVRGYDRLHRLAFGSNTRAFRNMKDSEVASQLAAHWKLTAQVEDTPATYEYLLQANQTDLEFLRERARRLRYEVRVSGKTLFFGRPKETAGKVATLTMGENLLTFSPRLSLVGSASKVSVQGWSHKDKKDVRGQAGSGDETTRLGGTDTGARLVDRVVGAGPQVVVDDPPVTPEEAELVARGRFNDLAFALVRGEGVCMGDPQVKAGTVVELRELGRRFSGQYYVTSSTHTVSTRKGYTTRFAVRRSAA